MFIAMYYCIGNEEMIGNHLGLSGRGLLEKFGPNHAAFPIITRYANDDDGSGVMVAGRKVLEVFLDCSRGDESFLPEIKGIYNDLLPREVSYLTLI